MFFLFYVFNKFTKKHISVLFSCVHQKNLTLLSIGLSCLASNFSYICAFDLPFFWNLVFFNISGSAVYQNICIVLLYLHFMCLRHLQSVHLVVGHPPCWTSFSETLNSCLSWHSALNSLPIYSKARIISDRILEVQLKQMFEILYLKQVHKEIDLIQKTFYAG